MRLPEEVLVHCIWWCRLVLTSDANQEKLNSIFWTVGKAWPNWKSTDGSGNPRRLEPAGRSSSTATPTPIQVASLADRAGRKAVQSWLGLDFCELPYFACLKVIMINGTWCGGCSGGIGAVAAPATAAAAAVCTAVRTAAEERAQPGRSATSSPPAVLSQSIYCLTPF